MNRQEKEQEVQSLKNKFENSTATFLVGYKGLSVDQMADLRKKLREKGGMLKVAKVTLMRRALQEVPEAKELQTVLGDQVAVVFSQQEPPAVAKVLCDYSGEVNQLQVIAGCYESSLLAKDDVKAFASLPSREVLLSMLCGTLKAPIAKLAQVGNALLAKPLYALKEIEKKKGS